MQRILTLILLSACGNTAAIQQSNLSAKNDAIHIPAHMFLLQQTDASNHTSLALIDTDSGERTQLSLPEDNVQKSLGSSLSPDLAFAVYHAGQILNTNTKLVKLADGSVTQLSPQDAKTVLQGGGFSPDSRYYIFAVELNDASSRAFITELATGTTSEIAEVTSNAVFVKWSQDNKHVALAAGPSSFLVYNTETHVADAYTGVDVLEFTATGRFAVMSAQSTSATVSVVDMRDGSSRTFGDNVSAWFGMAGPVGDRIAYLSLNHGATYDLYVLDVSEAADPVLRAQGLNVDPNSFKWAPNGDSLYYVKSSGIYQVAYAGDSSAQAITDVNDGDVPVFSPNGRSFTFTARNSDETRSMYVFDQAAVRMSTGTGALEPVWSADSQLLAFRDQQGDGSEILRVVRSDGTSVFAQNSAPGEQLYPMQLTSDYLVFERGAYQVGTGTLERLDLATGLSTVLATIH